MAMRKTKEELARGLRIGLDYLERAARRWDSIGLDAQLNAESSFYSVYTDWHRLNELRDPGEYEDVARRMEAMIRFMSGDPRKEPYRAPV